MRQPKTQFTHILLDDKGVIAINAFDYFNYKKSIIQTIKEGVYFKDYQEITLLAAGLNIWHLEKHKPYPIPEKYEVNIDTDHPHDECKLECICTFHDDYYAILVPEEKEINCKEYCNCAREAMERGANRDWVDGLQDNCPLTPKEKGAGDDYPVIPQPEKSDIQKQFNDNIAPLIRYGYNQALIDIEQYMVSILEECDINTCEKIQNKIHEMMASKRIVDYDTMKIELVPAVLNALHHKEALQPRS